MGESLHQDFRIAEAVADATREEFREFSGIGVVTRRHWHLS